MKAPEAFLGLDCLYLCGNEALFSSGYLDPVGDDCRAVQDEVEAVRVGSFSVDCLASFNFLVFEVLAEFNLVLIVEQVLVVILGCWLVAVSDEERANDRVDNGLDLVLVICGHLLLLLFAQDLDDTRQAFPVRLLFALFQLPGIDLISREEGSHTARRQGVAKENWQPLRGEPLLKEVKAYILSHTVSDQFLFFHFGQHLLSGLSELCVEGVLYFHVCLVRIFREALEAVALGRQLPA